MLKINLLPPYVYEGAKRRTAFWMWCLLVILASAGMCYLRYTVDQEGATYAKQAADELPKAQQAAEFTAKAAAVTAESAEIVSKVTFVDTARKHDRDTYPPRVANVIDYTTSNVLYSSFTPSGNTISMSAFAPTLSDVADYVMWMEHNPEITNVSISLNSIPSFPLSDDWYATEKSYKERPGSGGHTFEVVLTLVKPLEGGPSFTPGAAAAPSAARPSSPIANDYQSGKANGD